MWVTSPHGRSWCDRTGRTIAACTGHCRPDSVGEPHSGVRRSPAVADEAGRTLGASGECMLRCPKTARRLPRNAIRFSNACAIDFRDPPVDAIRTACGPGWRGSSVRRARIAGPPGLRTGAPDPRRPLRRSVLHGRCQHSDLLPSRLSRSVGETRRVFPHRRGGRGGRISTMPTVSAGAFARERHLATQRRGGCSGTQAH